MLEPKETKVCLGLRECLLQTKEILDSDEMAVFMPLEVKACLNGIDLGQSFLNNMVAFMLSIGTADGKISAKEVDCLNLVFNLQGDAASYERLYNNIPSDIHDHAPIWVIALASLPKRIDTKTLVENTLENAGILMAAIDGADQSEAAVLSRYIPMCLNVF